MRAAESQSGVRLNSLLSFPKTVSRPAGWECLLGLGGDSLTIDFIPTDGSPPGELGMFVRAGRRLCND